MPVALPCSELSAWLRLSTEPDLGYSQACLLLREFGLPDAIYDASSTQLAKWLPMPLATRMAAHPDTAHEALLHTTRQWLEHPDHHLLTLADPDYPKALLELHDPPLVLYVNGALPVLNQPGLAIVGARTATPGGCDNANAFAHYLAQRGWCIVSGLAEGIDTAAHEGALESPDGRTIAVMATGLDIVFPARNRELAHRIAGRGALVSEFPLGTRALPFHFPRRNRLVAALGRGVLVVEAAQKSGSLITARLGAELGREVFAIPGSIHSPVARGCHQLIRQGAKLVESGQDIHDELQQPGLIAIPKPAGSPFPKGKQRIARPKPAEAHTLASPHTPSGAPTPKATTRTDTDITTNADINAQANVFSGLSPQAYTVLNAMGFDPVDMDTLQERTALDWAQLSTLMVELELNQAITRHNDGQFARYR